MIKLFNENCIYNKEKNETLLYGLFQESLTQIVIEVFENNVQLLNCELYQLVICDNRPDFYIKIDGFFTEIHKIDFHFSDNKIHTMENIPLVYPFLNCDLLLDKKSSAIITTMCKNYSHRLDEWIQYHLKLGFSGIVIFNNSKNDGIDTNESQNIFVTNISMEQVVEKYKGKVFMVDYPYSPFPNVFWNSIQSVSLYIGVNEFGEQWSPRRGRSCSIKLWSRSMRRKSLETNAEISH